MSQKNLKWWERLLFSDLLVGQSTSHKIAVIGVMTAVMVVANMFFEFKLAETQFSFTIVLSALTGVIIGPVFGFVACFMGDLVGFFYNSAGFAYLPWIGISSGLTALIAGLIINGLPEGGKGFLFFKIGLVCVLTFVICTVEINTRTFWEIYCGLGDGKYSMEFQDYLYKRLILGGQIWNSLVNYALLFLTVPAVKKLKL